MEFGPHAPFTDPVNLAMAKDRLARLKGYAAMGFASPAQYAEMADLSQRIAAYYQRHVEHFVQRAMGKGPYNQQQIDAGESRLQQLVRETEGVQ